MNFKRLNQDIILEEYLGRSGDGTPSYGTPQLLKGFAYGATRTIKDANGIEVVSDKTVLLIYDTTTPKNQDRVTLSGGEKRQVLNCEILPLKNKKVARLEI